MGWCLGEDTETELEGRAGQSWAELGWTGLGGIEQFW